MTMEIREITLRLPEAMFRAVDRLAKDRGTTLEHVVQGSLAVELKRATRGKVVKGGAADEHVSALRVHLGGMFARAQSWDALCQVLRRHGYALRPVGTGLALVLRETGLRLCRVAELGHPYQSLCQRFGGPLPEKATGDEPACGALPCEGQPRRQAEVISLFH